MNEFSDRNQKKEVYLGDWAASLGSSMPALLLNATVVETGRPIVFSTSDFPHDEKEGGGLGNFYHLYPKLSYPYDIRVNTAARLSASFPYVAPAGRSNLTPPPVPDFHIVDGGYYDNYGIGTLLGWLQSAINDSSVSATMREEVKKDLADVLVLGIRPFAPSANQVPQSPHGWGFQLVAPIKTMLDVRNTGQLSHDDRELALFTSSYRPGVKVWRADFVYPKFTDKDQKCNDAPLSWKLSLDQLQCIDDGWEKIKADKQKGTVNPEIGCVMDFLSDLKSNDSQPWSCRPGDVPYNPCGAQNGC
jgi:hypothetical protein